VVLKTVFPLLGTLGHEWVSELMGSSLTSQLDELQVLTVRKVSGVLRCPSSVWRFLSLVLKTRFPLRTEVEARVAHSDARARS